MNLQKDDHEGYYCPVPESFLGKIKGDLGAVVKRKFVDFPMKLGVLCLSRSNLEVSFIENGGFEWSVSEDGS